MPKFIAYLGVWLEAILPKTARFWNGYLYLAFLSVACYVGWLPCCTNCSICNMFELAVTLQDCDGGRGSQKKVNRPPYLKFL